MNAKQKETLIEKLKTLSWLVGVLIATFAFADSRLDKKIDQRIDSKLTPVMKEILKISFMVKSVTSDSVYEASKKQADEATEILKGGRK